MRYSGWHEVLADPMRNKTLALRSAFAELAFPTGFADIQSLVGMFLIIKQCMEIFLVPKMAGATLAGVRPRLNVPFDHESNGSKTYLFISPAPHPGPLLPPQR